VIDRLLKTLVTRGLRRGLGGEPVWLALGTVAWLVRRSRRRRNEVLWTGRVQAGERLVVRAYVPGEAAPPVAG
jgi:hypothetical protein